MLSVFLKEHTQHIRQDLHRSHLLIHYQKPQALTVQDEFNKVINVSTPNYGF